MMRRLILVLVLTMLGSGKEERAPNRFPHKLWIYWHDSDISSAPLFTQLCINNIKHYAALSGWELTIINNNNIGQYITEESNKKLTFLKQRIPLLAKRGLTPQALSDLFRSFLLHDNGGMWNDISSVFLRDFSWVQNLEQFELVDNSIAKQPQIFMYTSDMIFGGNKTVIFDEKSQRDVYLFPGLQFWSVIAKPRSKFFKDMIEELVYTFSQESLEAYIKNKQKQGYLYLQQKDEYLAFSTIHFQTILQRKQKEIDSDPAKFAIKYAIEHYGIWSASSYESAYSLFYCYAWEPILLIHHMFYQPFSSLPQIVKKAPFIKFIGIAANFSSDFLDKAAAMDCNIKVEQLSHNSFISQHLFRHSEDLSFVKKIRSSEAKGWSESKCTSSELKNAIDGIGNRLLIIVTAFILLIVCLVGGLRLLGAAIDERVTKACAVKAQNP